MRSDLLPLTRKRQNHEYSTSHFGAVRPARGHGIRRGDRWRRPRRPVGRHPAQAAGRPRRKRAFCRGAGKRFGAGRAHSLGRHHGSAFAERADSRLEGKRRAVEPARHGRSLCLSEPQRRRRAGARRAAAAFCRQPRLLHRQPGQRHALAGRAGRRAGRGNLPRLSRRRSAV